MTQIKRHYWDHIAGEYQQETIISCEDFHYGPLLPGDTQLNLLPSSIEGLDCLELGSGTAHNSIYLARRGARCTALDISAHQLRAAAELADTHKISINLIQGDLDHLPFASQPRFDLIHSSYALPFTSDPGQAIRQMADLLKPGGRLIISTAHPLANAEWLEVDEGEQGVFLQDYFHPPVDSRTRNGMTCQSRPVPVSTLFNWFTTASLTVTNLLEPEPLPIPSMSADDISRKVPYVSQAWQDSYAELAAIPFVIIIAAQKTANSTSY